MFAVDVGGTFTDVVAIRDGRIEVTKVPSDPSRPEQPVVEGARRLGVEGSPVFNHASTMGLNAVITRRLPKIGFLTTEGHRDMLDRGRVWRPLDAQTDPAWRRPFGDAARPLVPRYLRRGVHERILADGSVLLAARRGAGPPPARGARTLRRAGRRRLPAQLLRRSRSRGAAPRARPGGARGRRDLALLGGLAARQGVRARLDGGRRRAHEAHLHRLRASSSTATCAGSASTAPSTSPTARPRCCPGTRRSRSPSASSSPAPPRARSRAPGSARRSATGNLLCCDVGGTSTDISLVARRPAVRRQHVRARARPDHQRAVDGDLERGRRRWQHRLDLAVRATCSSGRAAPAPTRVPPATGAAARRRRSPTPACSWASSTPTGSPGASCGSTPTLARQGVRVARHAAAARPADRVRVPHRGREHRRGGAERRHPPRRRPARLHASSPTAPPGRCCFLRRSSCCT